MTKSKSGTSAQHMSNTDNWGTPRHLVELGRESLGGRIDLDPASNAYWNETIGAARIITAEQDGLTTPWNTGKAPITVFINPPGDKFGKLVPAFWRVLIENFRSGRIEHAYWVGFSLEQLPRLQTMNGHAMGVLDFPTMIPPHRECFLVQDPEGGLAKAATQPGHGNYVTFISSSSDAKRAFRRLAGRLGKVTG